MIVGEVLRCPLCESAAVVRRFRKPPAEYFACRGCGLLFTPAPAEQETAATYSPDYYALRQGLTSKARDEVARFRRQNAAYHLEVIESRSDRGALLDVGCGEGYFLEVARQRGWTTLCGIDVSATAVRLASRVAEARQGTLSSLGLPAATFDVVCWFDSLEHVVDPQAELSETARLLKRGGLLYLVTPDAGAWVARLMGSRWFQIKPQEHFCLFSRASLRFALERVGLVDIEFGSSPKFLTLSFVHTILSTTNPLLAGALRLKLGWLPWWNSILRMPTGDLRAIARR